MAKETVVISRKEYEDLLDTQHFMDCLDAAGVDNWCGYGDACEMYNEELGENVGEDDYDE